MADEVIPQAASAPAEQSAPQAPASETTTVQETQSAPAESPAATATPDLLHRVQALETELADKTRRYNASTEESLRLLRENEALKAQKPPAPSAPPVPTYSPEQLVTWKQEWLVAMAKGVNKAGDPVAADQAAYQVQLIDDKLMEMKVNNFATKQTASAAYKTLQDKVNPIIQQYKDELKPGMPIYDAANEWHKQAVAAGMPDNDMTATSALAWALVQSGKLQQGVAAKASQEATGNLNKAIKSAAAAGSGAANQNAAPTTDWKEAIKTKDGKQKFAEYRKSLGVGS